VPKFTGAFNTTATYDQLLQNEQYLTEALAPEDDRRTFTATRKPRGTSCVTTRACSSPSHGFRQWLEGVISDKAAGYVCFRNTKLPTHVCGSFSTTAAPVVNGAGQSTRRGNAFVSPSR